MSEVSRVAAGELTPGDSTPGMTREAAVVLDEVWTGRALTEAGRTSGWHHHGDHDTVIYVVAGAIRVETADGAVLGEPGDFLHVPAHTVHREGNPTDGLAEIVLLRTGSGPTTVNVERP